MLALALAAAGCSKQSASEPGTTGLPPGAAATQDDPTAPPEMVVIDGSSTVHPITEAVAEEFQKTHPARVTIGVSGTGGGFKKFCGKETAITGASRPIKPSEAEACAAAGVEYIELPVAYDGLAVVVNPQATWAESMTVAELKTLWEPEAQGKVTRWSQVRKGWPDKEIHLFGAGVDSGTYDYFTAAVVGKEHASRGDFTSSEDDNVLVQGVAGDLNGLGFFGFAYYSENKNKLKLLPIDDGKDENGKGPIAPSLETVANGTYQPLSRPIFVYVSKQAATGASVKAFVEFYLKHAAALSREVGYIPLPDTAHALVAARFAKGVTGSAFGGTGSKVGMTVEELLAGEK
jgi:phosphate transport system substrate-binding protein